METLVSGYIDGNLTGVQKWYTESHIKGCKQCQASIPFLQALRARTLTLGVEQAQPELQERKLDPNRWEKIETEWDQAEQP
jgi:hypothetical protein